MDRGAILSLSIHVKAMSAKRTLVPLDEALIAPLLIASQCPATRTASPSCYDPMHPPLKALSVDW
jgi:hypothetical protein